MFNDGTPPIRKGIIANMNPKKHVKLASKLCELDPSEVHEMEHNDEDAEESATDFTCCCKEVSGSEKEKALKLLITLVY